MNRINRFIRSNYVTPLSKSVNSRHLALEPLCCIQSCKIRSGCTAVGVFEGIGVFCIFVYCISELSRAVGRGETYNRVRSYEDFARHPACYAVLIILCIVWTLSILAFLFGVRRFHARFIQMHLVVQGAAMLVCLVVVVAGAVLLSTTRRRSADGDTGGQTTATGGSTTTIDPAAISKSDRRRLTEQAGLVSCCLYLLAVEAWGITVVYDCYKYFKLCQVLVNLAKVKQGKPPNAAGQQPAQAPSTTGGEKKQSSVAKAEQTNVEIQLHDSG